MAWPAIIAAIAAVASAAASANGQKRAAEAGSQGAIATALANRDAQLAQAAAQIGKPPASEGGRPA